MNPILLKLFATALALSQVTTRPDAVKTEFDPLHDQAEVVQILTDGCTHMRRVFDIEDLNLDDLIATAMADPGATVGEIKSFRGLNFGDLHDIYRQFCKGETPARSAIDIREIIEFYNKALVDLPDHTKLKGFKLPEVSVILDRKGASFAELFEPDHRRIWVPLSEVPEPVQKAFLAAEDKRFYEHAGIDERSVVRAFIGTLSQPGRPQGGSTITQQMVKNVLVGDDLTYERKIREIIVAARVERTLTKAEILELYLNSIYFGRSAWGIEMAAQSYFGKRARKLSAIEGAFLAGLTKGPNYYSPDRRPDRARERLAYVLSRMQEDGAITAEQMKQALIRLPPLVPHERPRRETGFYFVDHLTREAKALAGIENLTAASYTVRSTVVPELQRAVEAALQEGLARYELNTRRLVFQGPEANLAEAIARIEADRKAPRGEPAWQQALRAVRLPLYDVHWPIAVVLEKTRENRNEVVRVGLLDGRILPLTVWSNTVRGALQVHDVVYVTVIEAKGRTPARAELRVRPTVQGAAVAIENRTGRILAMSGGFSYPLSQLNRVTQAQRQPGSSLKPLTFLAALGAGLQPNTLVLDAPMTFPPIGNPLYAQAKDYWTPKNYDGGVSGYVTLRYGLEHSKNLVTARLLDGGVAALPEDSLDRICALAMEVQLYPDCVRYYPFILGAQPVRLIDLVTFYATIANEGMRPTPYAIESVMRGNDYVYRARPGALTRIGSADGVAFYQLKTILQGVLERGTGRSIRHLAPFVAGKTGTSDDENDAWFVGFTNDVTVGVWVGFDNADGKRRTLGPGQTGSRVAIPIFAPIMNAVWEQAAPRVALGPPSPETRVRLAAVPVNARTGEQLPPGSPNAVIEYFRLDGAGEVVGTQYRLAQRHGIYTEHEGNSFGERLFNGGLFFGFPFFQSRGDYSTPPGSIGGETAPRGRYRPDPDFFH